MNDVPLPVVFEPILKAKPWGGRELERLFGKRLPPETPIGESWEVAHLPACESRVARGPLAGTTLGELMRRWEGGLVGDVSLVDGRFPLLIKFLDAREKLSIQVHPRRPATPGAADPPGIKHEAWYVVDAAPGAGLYIGLLPRVTVDDVRKAGPSAALAELLRFRPVKRGDCFYLPSGTPHALGAGIVVAEIQTPSDVTYRLYDWGRRGLDGRPRELHFETALANLLPDVAEHEIVQPRSHSADVFAAVTALVRCPRFLIDKVRFVAGMVRPLPHAQMVIWIILRGRGRLVRAEGVCSFAPGDTVMIPAAMDGLRVETEEICELLEVRIPIPSRYAVGTPA